jgi:manganese/zinc/iron transport system substrate-binding protein
VKVLNASLLLLTILLTGCARQGQGKVDLSDRPIVNVVATTGMIADAVREVGGERVKVTGLMGAGVDPHNYEPTVRDQTAMDGADIIFYNGLHLEGQMGNLFKKMSAQRPTVAVASGVPAEKLIAIKDFPDGHDPHIWHDASVWKHAVERIRDTLSTHDPKHADLYKKNAARHLDDLSALHEEIKKKAQELPEGKRVMVTAHDAFNYFARAYGFKVHGLQGVSTEAEASVADVQRLAQFIADNKVPAVFVESSVNQKNMQAVRDAALEKGAKVEIVGEKEGDKRKLFSDALGDDGTPEAKYGGMLRHNVKVIVDALK